MDDEVVSTTQSPSSSSSSTTTTVPTATSTLTGNDTETETPAETTASNSFVASPGILSAIVGLGIAVATAVGVQSYFRLRRDSPSEDGGDKDEGGNYDDGNDEIDARIDIVEDGDLETVDL